MPDREDVALLEELMDRRRIVAAPAVLALFGVATACQTTAEQTTDSAASGAQKQDLKKVASDLHTRTAALIDAINSKNDANIGRAKTELQKEADRAEDAVKSETGPTANQINSAVNNIRGAVLSNNVAQLERAKALLQQASQ
ncbi:MAG: hypothetical protein HY332_17665 [Chloroflexi bacterium]|nr:hypothetical protein [Chloroflexota bacterium]